MVSADILAKKFVKSYYTSLSFAPEKITNFYSSESKQRVSVDSEPADIAEGKENINANLVANNIYGCVVNLDDKPLNYVEVDESSYLIQVLGTFFINNSYTYDFSQSFLLVLDPHDSTKKHYYIKTDIISLTNGNMVNEEPMNEVTETMEVVETVPEEEQQQQVVEEQIVEEEEIPVPEPEAEQFVEELPTEVEQVVIESELPEETRTEEVTVETEPVVVSEHVEEPVKPRSWAHVVSSNIVAAPVTVAAPVATPVAPVAAPVAVAPVAAAKEEEEEEIAAAKEEDQFVPANRRASKNEKKNSFTIFLKNINEDVTKELLEAQLSLIGSNYDISLIPNKPFGFVNVDNEQEYRSLLNGFKNGILIKDTLVELEPRKENKKNKPYTTKPRSGNIRRNNKN